MSDIKHIFQLPEAGRDFDDDALYVGRLGTSPQNRRLPIRSLVGASVRLDWEDALDLDEYGDDLTVFVEGDGGAVSWSGDLQDGRRLTVVNECAGELEVFGEVVPVGGSVSAVWVDGVRGAWLGGGLTPDSVGMVELKTEVKDKLPPPSVFFPTDEASLLEALAADGVRTIIMSQPIVLTDNTIPIGSGVCNLNTHEGVSTLILSPTNSTATTLTGGGAVIYVDGDLSTLGFVLNGVEIYCKRMAVGGDQTVTATTTEKLYYERMVCGSLTGAVQQRYWLNTYTPQPDSIGLTELKDEVTENFVPDYTSSEVGKILGVVDDGEGDGVLDWVEMSGGGESKVATHRTLYTPYDFAGGWHKIAESSSGSFTPCILSLGAVTESTGGTDKDSDSYLNMAFIVGKKGKKASVRMIYNASKRNNQSVPTLDGGIVDGIKIADGTVWIHQMYQIRSGSYRVPISNLRVEIRDLGFAITKSSSLQVIPSTTTDQIGQLSEPVGTNANAKCQWDSFYLELDTISSVQEYDIHSSPFITRSRIFGGNQGRYNALNNPVEKTANYVLSKEDQNAIRSVVGSRTITIPLNIESHGAGTVWTLHIRTENCTLSWGSGISVDGVEGSSTRVLYKGCLYFLLRVSANVYWLISTDGFKPEGATGSFTDPNGKTVTVTNGLITAITPP